MRPQTHTHKRALSLALASATMAASPSEIIYAKTIYSDSIAAHLLSSRVRRGSRGGGPWGAHAPPPLSSTEYTFIYHFWIKYAPNCRKMHLKFQKFLGACLQTPQGRTPAMSALPVYHPHHTPPPFSKIMDPHLRVKQLTELTKLELSPCKYY